jgi:hypothetical protein
MKHDESKETVAEEAKSHPKAFLQKAAAKAGAGKKVRKMSGRK